MSANNTALARPREPNNPFLDMLAVIKGAIAAVFDLRGDESALATLPAALEHGGDRSCIDVLRRLLGAGGATELRINALPARCLRANDALDYDQQCCAICLDGYEHNNRVRILPCNHCFHVNCIDVWLRKRATCPMCNMVVC